MEDQEMKRLAATLIAVLALSQAALGQDREPSTYRLYGPQGQSLGTFSTSGNTTIFYDERGSKTGSATTIGGTTTFYGPQGQVTGHSYGRK
jgi:YD repeat-containing protein